MKKSARIAAAGAAALLTAAVGVLGAGAASADDREYSTDGTRVTSVPAGHDWNNAFPDDRLY
jgi:ABC-type glycerol-3-phosphate transport system substrate-binding protein